MRGIDHQQGHVFSYLSPEAAADAAGPTSDEYFSVDGTLLEAWASLKSFQPKQGKKNPPPDDAGNPTVDFHGERRSNETHRSTWSASGICASWIRRPGEAG